MPRPTAELAYYPSLDGVRGIAILLVLLHNTDEMTGHDSVLGRVVDVMMDRGWIGVQLFFVLSGFLITGALLESRAAPNYYRAFFGRRTLRIFPLYYSVLFALLVLLPLLTGFEPDPHARTSDKLWLWLYLSNWAQPLGYHVNGFAHFWSLAVEEQFYLIWPFVVRHCDAARLLRTCAGMFLLALIARIALRVTHADPEMIYEFTICRMDSLATGAAVAALVRLPGVHARLRIEFPRLVAIALMLVAAGGAATHFYARSSFAGQTLGYALLSLVLAVLVLAGYLRDTRSAVDMNPDSGTATVAAGSWWPLRHPALRLLGKYSYGIYIFHRLCIVFYGEPLLRELYGDEVPLSLGRQIVYSLAVSATSVVAAVASYHLLERPFLRLKRLFVPATPANADIQALPIDRPELRAR